ncbi:Cytochrome c oxidase subunit 6 [Globomyces sp. JEL0801]|nr:Cytochrome c oxidase subunit 6 [Globomyces sp. JEL0801]
MNSIKRISSLRKALPQSKLFIPVRNYSELDPANSKDYEYKYLIIHFIFSAFVEQWHSHFKKCDDDFELERGLNNVFAADWVPSVEIISEALKASRRLNTFATAVRIIEALEEKAYKKEQFQAYLKELKPLLDEYGVPTKSELGPFAVTYERNPLYE